MSKATLSAAITGKYKMAPGFAPGTYTFAGREIDTSTCDLAEADTMVGLGFNLLVKVATGAAKKPAAEK